jgi:TatA/E family protein of Tat protein translocase
MVGPQEIVIVAAVAAVLFGASRLPAFGRGLGEAVRELRRAVRDVSEPVTDVKEEIVAQVGRGLQPDPDPEQ